MCYCSVIVAHYGHADHTSAEATSTKAGAITVVGGVLKTCLMC